MWALGLSGWASAVGVEDLFFRARKAMFSTIFSWLNFPERLASMPGHRGGGVGVLRLMSWASIVSNIASRVFFVSEKTVASIPIGTTPAKIRQAEGQTM